jgi:hypothetical protein
MSAFLSDPIFFFVCFLFLDLVLLSLPSYQTIPYHYHRMPFNGLFGRLTGPRNGLAAADRARLGVSGPAIPLKPLKSAPSRLARARCMSEDHASPPQSASGSTSGDGPASNLSASNAESPSTSQTNSRRGSQQPWPAASRMNSYGIDFGQLLVLSQEYDNSPQAAKQWLKSFKDLRSSSNVSIKLVATKVFDTSRDHGTRAAYPSMLPILSKWLRTWFDRTHAARSQKRKTHTDRAQKIFVPEDDDFEWICAYTTDYLTLDHGGLAEEDIVGLIEAALHICSKSGATIDFDRLLKLLVSVCSRYGCPSSVFGKLLYLLCGIQGSFPDRPAHFKECLGLILRTPQSETVQTLHSFLRTDTSKLEDSKMSTTTNAARGTIQIFQQILGTELGAAISNGDLLSSLSSATMLQSGRVNEAVLSLCVTLAEQDPSISKSSDKQFLDFMEIVNTAYAAVKIRNQTTEGSQSSSERSSNDLRLGGNGTPANVRDTIDIALEKIMQSSTGYKQRLVFDHFLTCAELQSPETSLRILEYAGKELLSWQHHEHWRDDGLQILQAFVSKPSISSTVRLAAIGTLEDALWSSERSWSHQDEGCLNGPEGTTTVDLVRGLLGVIRIETDPLVLQALVNTAIRAVMTYDNYNYTKQTCNDLAEIVSREGSGTEAAQSAEIGARGLVSIFMQSLNSDHLDRTDLAYRKLNKIASSFPVPAEARLAAMRLLFRIRCDSTGRIYISESSDSEYLAAALCRTTESAAKFPHPAEGSDDYGTIRSSGLTTRRPKPTPPLWIYPGVPALPHVPEPQPSEFVVAPGSEVGSWSGRPKPMELELSIWLESVIACLQKDPDWETYSYIIVHMGAQLSNVTLWEGTVPQIQFLRSVLCEQVRTSSFREPPVITGLKKGDVALCVFNGLTPLIAYNAHFSRNECDALVKAFMMGVGSFEGTSRGCIHSLSICCFEIPASVTKHLSGIIHKIQTNATQSHLSMHFLEFFAGLARLPDVHTNLRGDEVRLIFGICVAYIKSMRDRRAQTPASSGARPDSTTSRLSGISVPPFRAKILSAVDLPQYVSALAYHTMIFWFLSLKLSERAKHVPWIIKSLIFVDNEGNEQMEEQSEVFIDMMQRTAFSDLGETLPHPDFAKQSDGSVSTVSWLVGLSIVTIETAGTTGLSQITKRQASGTTHSVYQQLTADLPAHHAALSPDMRPTSPTAMLPQHILLQQVTTCAPTSLGSQPLPLPDAEYVKRALKAFDLNPTVDGNKVGVIYVGPGQTQESEILANTRGSPDFDDFLEGLGTKVKVVGAKFNTQGLSGETDGEYTYAWRDRVTEVVYHIPSMMPTCLEDDPRCTNKKMHIGNDHVNIIFNRSGQAFDFDTFNSQFNYVNIVVTPASRVFDSRISSPAEAETREADTLSPPTTSSNKPPQFYEVQTLTAEGFPAISPASDPKIISSTNLAGFVRLIALNASVFSLAWRDRDSPTDHISSWRNRLQEIRRLRDRVTREAAAATLERRKGGALYAGYGRASSGRTSLYPEGRGELTGERKTPVVDYENVDVRGDEKMVAEQYDFSRWTLQ